MSEFAGTTDYNHLADEKIGVLLVNLGTPDAPTSSACRRYLKQFLSDRRVIEAPRWLWWWILRLKILPFRPKRTAAAYGKIWTLAGSPLLLICQRQQVALQAAMESLPVRVVLGMSYGTPSIADAMRELADCRRLLVLPMYPQYAGSTTASVFDDVARCLSRRRRLPHLRFIADYCDDPRFITVLADSIRAHWQRNGKADKLLFSFHGTPLAMLTSGDPYHCLCHKTARLTAEVLGLSASDWMLTFQSRFGRAVWLQPYTDKTLEQLPKSGIKRVQVVCPGFAADCLETLEEIAQENREIFLAAGGKSYDYISALNGSPAHINFLRNLLADAAADWLPAVRRNNANRKIQQDRYDALRQQPFYQEE